MADTALTYVVSAVIVIRFAGGTPLELAAGIGVTWLLIYLLQATGAS